MKKERTQKSVQAAAPAMSKQQVAIDLTPKMIDGVSEQQIDAAVRARTLRNDSHAERMLDGFVQAVDVLMEALEYAEGGNLMNREVTA